jgi:hypothetical protein
MSGMPRVYVQNIFSVKTERNRINKDEERGRGKENTTRKNREENCNIFCYLPLLVIYYVISLEQIFILSDY